MVDQANPGITIRIRGDDIAEIAVVELAEVLGEYGALVSSTDMEEVCPLPQVVDRLCVIAERPKVGTETTALVSKQT